jgi:hypothetical protein
MSFLAVVLAHSEATAPLPIPPWAFGAIAFAVFSVLCIILWSYRDVANRHSHKAAPHAADHAGAPGATRHGAGHPSDSGH